MTDEGRVKYIAWVYTTGFGYRNHAKNTICVRDCVFALCLCMCVCSLACFVFAIHMSVCALSLFLTVPYVFLTASKERTKELP